MAGQEFTTEELENESWKAIQGYEGYYSVSDLGRIRRDCNGTCTWSGRIIKPKFEKTGYARVSLSINNNRRSITIHCAVAVAFLGPRPIGMEVNHKDGDKKNNRSRNLEYVSGAGNMQHALSLGLMANDAEHGRRVKATTPRGESHYAATAQRIKVNGHTRICKLTIHDVEQIKVLLTTNIPRVSIAKLFKVSRGTIFRIQAGTTRRQY